MSKYKYAAIKYSKMYHILGEGKVYGRPFTLCGIPVITPATIRGVDERRKTKPRTRTLCSVCRRALEKIKKGAS